MLPIARSEVAQTRRQPGSDAFTTQSSLDAQKEWLAARGIPNPYFPVHEGVAGARSHIGGRELINFSSYNYAGLCGVASVNEAAKAAIDRYGTSVSASRIVSGERPIHRELEGRLASFLGVEDSLVFVSGHLTNVTVIGELAGPGDVVLHDTHIHNSALLGCQLSGARRLAFPHNNWQALDRLLARQRAAYGRALILLEGVYSMEGDVPELPRFLEIKRRHGAQLMVDEAHATGVLGAHGRGLAEHFGVNPAEIDLWMGTLSKAFASCGGYVAGSHAFIEALRYRTPGFMFSVGLMPAAAAASLEALRLLEAEPERPARLRARAELFRELARAEGWNIGLSAHSAIVPILLGDSEKALRLSAALFRLGVNVQPIVFPAVARNKARLRFFFSSEHTEAEVRATVAALREGFAVVEREMAEAEA